MWEARPPTTLLWGYSIMIIGVIGKKRSGKDTFYTIAKEYLEQQGFTVVRLAFADKVKEFAKTYFNVDTEKEEDKEKSRFILQGIGQMFREEVSKGYWIDSITSKVKFDKNTVYIITDVRYKNEVATVLLLGKVVKVENPNTETYDSHPSETDLDDLVFHDVIMNDEGLDVYVGRVREWLRENVLT